MQNSTFLKFIVITSFLFICTKAVFANTSDSNIGTMHVQISNRTGNDCKAISGSPQRIHGILDSLPPGSLINGASAAFDIEQRLFYGPDLILSYDCSSSTSATTQMITFEIAQGYSLFKGNTPTFKVLVSNGLTANAPSIVGSSWFYGSVGLINVDISKL